MALGWKVVLTFRLIVLNLFWRMVLLAITATQILPGNLCRITVLSKRLNPGDSIYMIYYAKGDPNLISGTSVEGCETIVSYASKAN